MDVRMFTVGPVAENAYLFRREGSDRALLLDPGEEAPKLLAAIDALGVRLDGILVTHTHFDHIRAVAPVAKATGAEVWVPEIEQPVLADAARVDPGPDRLAAARDDRLSRPHGNHHTRDRARGEPVPRRARPQLAWPGSKRLPARST